MSVCARFAFHHIAQIGQHACFGEHTIGIFVCLTEVFHDESFEQLQQNDPNADVDFDAVRCRRRMRAELMRSQRI